MSRTQNTLGLSDTLRALAWLLAYPAPDRRRHLGQVHDALQTRNLLQPGRFAEISGLIASLETTDGLETEARYVETFDRSRRASLHLFEHVHGDSRERGPAMIDLGQMYAQAGLYLAPGELPDYLPALLEFASTQPPEVARGLLDEVSTLMSGIFSALRQTDSPYASVLGALLELSGHKAQAVAIAPDETIDASWEEPVAFDGCSASGQGKPGQARPGDGQPVRIVRKPRETSATVA